jgi:hypothetical protein
MSSTLRPPHRYSGRCRPRLERLESRLALSAPGVTLFVDPAPATGPVFAFAEPTTSPTSPVASLTTPGDGITPPPSVVTVAFHAPLAPFSLSELDVLVEVQRNGSWVSVFNFQDAPAESLDATGTQLSLTLARPLGPGDYRVVLPVTTNILYADFSNVVDFSQDQVLGAFTVEQPGVTLAGATPLGSPASTALTASSALDLQSDPGAVDLYQFTLPGGHHWRLGAEVLAQEIGSALRSDLTLFNAQGQPIATANTGLSSSPADPYLIEGLAPGTYYLGVSGAGNVPGTADGYNPATGGRGGNFPAETGGAYQLDVVANPDDAPTQVIGFSLQFADPLDPHPTGFALAFSGPLDLSALSGSTGPAIELVNQNGQAFPVTLIAQHETLAQYYFLVDQDLPDGQYSVVVPDASHGGLTDLAGFTPVALGEPAGVLATFNVSGQPDPNPYDLGPLYANAFTGVSRSDQIGPGAGVTYRFVVTTEGRYKVSSLFSGGPLTVQVLGPGVSVANSLGQPGQPSETELVLNPGVYYLQFQNVGASAATLDWTLRDLTTPGSLEAIVGSGLGQGPALAALSFTGTASGLSGSGSPGSAWPGQPAAGVSSSSAATTTGAPSPAGGGTTGTLIAPGGLFLTLGNTLVGRPTTESDHVAVVGPSNGTGSPALASSAAGLLQGISYGKAAGRLSPLDPVAETVDSGASAAVPGPVNGAMVAGADPDEPRTDELAIAAADWITRAGNAAARWMALAPPVKPEADAPEPEFEAEPIAVARDDSPVSSLGRGANDRIEQAQFGAPLAIGVASLVSLRYHQPLLRWMRRNRASSHGASTSTAVRGPHTRR